MCRQSKKGKDNRAAVGQLFLCRCVCVQLWCVCVFLFYLYKDFKDKQIIDTHQNAKLWWEKHSVCSYGKIRAKSEKHVIFLAVLLVWLWRSHFRSVGQHITDLDLNAWTNYYKCCCENLCVHSQGLRDDFYTLWAFHQFPMSATFW